MGIRLQMSSLLSCVLQSHLFLNTKQNKYGLLIHATVKRTALCCVRPVRQYFSLIIHVAISLSAVHSLRISCTRGMFVTRLGRRLHESQRTVTGRLHGPIVGPTGRSDPGYVRLSVRPVGQTGWTDCSRTAHMMSIKSMWPVSWL